MPAHGRSKNGIASHAYRGHPRLKFLSKRDMDGRDKPGHDEERAQAPLI
jgi:hypothetical protein